MWLLGLVVQLICLQAWSFEFKICAHFSGQRNVMVSSLECRPASYGLKSSPKHSLHSYNFIIITGHTNNRLMEKCQTRKFIVCIDQADNYVAQVNKIWT